MSETSATPLTYTLAVRLSLQLAAPSVLAAPGNREPAQMAPAEARALLRTYLDYDLPSMLASDDEMVERLRRRRFYETPRPNCPDDVRVFLWPVVQTCDIGRNIEPSRLQPSIQALWHILGRSELRQQEHLIERRALRLEQHTVILPHETPADVLRREDFIARMREAKVFECEHWLKASTPEDTVVQLGGRRAVKQAARGVVNDRMKTDAAPQTSLPASCLGGGLGERPSAQVVDIFSQPRRR